MDFPSKVQGQLASPKERLQPRGFIKKRVVVLDHKKNCPEVYTLADAMVLIDGNTLLGK